jgi:galactitol-specific phosphotransferase system IIC component
MRAGGSPTSNSRLKGFALMRAIIQESLPGLRERHARVVEFHRYRLGSWPWLVLIGLLVGVAVAAVYEGDRSHALGIAACAAGFPIWLVSEVRSVKVRGRRPRPPQRKSLSSGRAGPQHSEHFRRNRSIA